jgi:NADPH-dependent 2,4-dienoyl-CoA reductase/sulfur reductase-like enzyme
MFNQRCAGNAYLHHRIYTEVDQRRVIIVGSGPAGTRCAQTLVEAGLRPTVIDENARSGGQIYRRQPENFTRSYAILYGTEAEKASSVHSDFDAIRDAIDYRPNTLAWAISNQTLFAVQDNRSVELPFDALVLCTGATDRVMPTKGWNYAGTFSLGGAQIALKTQACAIGRQVVFLGAGPLLYLVASQYVAAGANVAAVLDTSTLADNIAALPKLLSMPSMLWRGMGLVRAIKKAGVPVVQGVRPIEISGSADDGVSGMSYRDSRGRVHELVCDSVALGYHLRSETQLADLAGMSFSFDPQIRQWVPDRDDDGRSASNIYMAGDGARLAGADAAETGGKLAALTLLADLGYAVDQHEIKVLRRTSARLARFAEGIARAFPWPVSHVRGLPDDVIVCRCEAVTVGQLRNVACAKEADEINRAKAFTRVGMGRCQGRFCGLAAAEIVANAAGIPVEKVGRLRGQAPVKPLSISVDQGDL